MSVNKPDNAVSGTHLNDTEFRKRLGTGQFESLVHDTKLDSFSNPKKLPKHLLAESSSPNQHSLFRPKDNKKTSEASS